MEENVFALEKETFQDSFALSTKQTAINSRFYSSDNIPSQIIKQSIQSNKILLLVLRNFIIHNK